MIDAEATSGPGFVDGHTHMDAQIFWDPYGTCSCWHGITSVVMGNCGFTLAPCADKDKQLVMRNLERAEDISADAMNVGIEWSWTTFREYLDTIERLPKGINYSGYLGHSALRTYVRASAPDGDARGRPARDGVELSDALQPAPSATTSRSPSPRRPTPSGASDAIGRGTAPVGGGRPQRDIRMAART